MDLGDILRQLEVHPSSAFGNGPWLTAEPSDRFSQVVVRKDL
jgi:hypothetical protein